MFRLLLSKLNCVTGDSARQKTLCLMAMGADNENDVSMHEKFSRGTNKQNCIKSVERVFDVTCQKQCVRSLPTHLKFAPFELAMM